VDLSVELGGSVCCDYRFDPDVSNPMPSNDDRKVTSC